MTRRLLISGLCASATLSAAREARAVYRGESDGEQIIDLSLGAGAVLAVGKAGVLISTDAGANWRLRPGPEVMSSCFALDKQNFWVTTPSGVWKSEDEGATWKRQRRGLGLERVYFLDSMRGYVCGQQKTVIETSDGGLTWTDLEAAAQPETSVSTTAYHWIHFVTPRVGIIAGSSRPARKGNTSVLPHWRDPMANVRRREWPASSITLETRDAGLSWKHSSTSLFGRISRVRYARNGQGLAVVEFHDAFEWPSEVFSINLRTGQSERVYREKERAVTDLLIFPGPSGYLAAIEPPKDPAVTTLGELHLLSSSDLKSWTEVELPVKVKTGRAFLAANSEDEIWLASESGVIFRISA